MTRFAFLASAAVALTALSACEVVDSIPAQYVTLGCTTAPALLPDLAEEIATGCAVYAATRVTVDVSGQDPALVAAALAAVASASGS